MKNKYSDKNVFRGKKSVLRAISLALVMIISAFSFLAVAEECDDIEKLIIE